MVPANNTHLDDALASAYVEFGVPADQFFANPDLTRAFLRLLSSRLKAPISEPGRTMRRLMTLRKMGRLPRLQRAYHGRSVSEN